jgi:hypothetical protein
MDAPFSPALILLGFWVGTQLKRAPTMTILLPPDADWSPAMKAQAYAFLLDNARDVSLKIWQRLQALHEHYPADLPDSLLTQIQGRRPRFDRRSAIRLVVSDLTVTIYAIGSAQPPLEARLCDRSPGGLSVWLPEPVEMGLVLYVRPADTPPDLPGTLAVVRNCRPADCGWVVGCAFTGR